MCVCVRACVCVCACVCLLVPDIVLYCVPCVREGPHLTYTTSILPVPAARLSRAWAASYWPTSQTSNCFDTWRRSPRRSSIQGCGVGRAIRTTAARSASGRRLGCVHTPHRLSNVALRALSRRFYQPLPLLYTGGPCRTRVPFQATNEGDLQTLFSYGCYSSLGRSFMGRAVYQ